MHYQDIFHARGGSYDRAMRLYPHARDEEFALPLHWAALRAGERIVDVPAGGGYLRRYVPASCTWYGHEPCAAFSEGRPAPAASLLPLPWPIAFAHVAISIAGCHHLDDKRPLFRELHRILLPGGRLVLADVHAESKVARFLDDFVGGHNSTGHSGDYLTQGTEEELRESGFDVVRAERVSYCWWFADRAGMAAFCRLLFDMRDIPDSEIAAAIAGYLGLRSRGRQVGMNWELFVLLGMRAVGAGA